jgi:hypothetical protein
MTRRQIFRLIAYSLTGVLLILLLVLYSLYLSAQRLPDFYKKSLTVDRETLEHRNKMMLQKIGNLNNDLQKPGESWQTAFTADDLNAYFAVELTKEGANLFPKEIAEPRLAFSDRQADFACRIEQGSFSGVLHLTLGLAIPEPNRFLIRIKGAKLGKLPVSKEIPAAFLAEALEKKSYPVQRGTEGGDPTISVTINTHYGKDRLVLLDGIVFQNGAVQITGSTEKPKE